MHRTEQKCDLLRVLFLGHADNPLVRETATSLRSQIELDAKIVLEDFDGSADLSAVEADLAVVFGGDGSERRQNLVLRVAAHVREGLRSIEHNAPLDRLCSVVHDDTIKVQIDKDMLRIWD